MSLTNRRKKYNVFINTTSGIKDEYINVSLYIDDIFITVGLADGRVIGYPLCNVQRVNLIEYNGKQ